MGDPSHATARFPAALPWFLGLLLGCAAWMLLASPSQAIPGFARQTNMSCTACHFQHFPKLNAFGRKFKASGYSITTDEPLEDAGLKLSPEFVASLKVAAEYRQESSPTDAGKLQIPAAHGLGLLLGGTVAEGIGGYVELSPALDGAKISFTTPLNWPEAQIGATAFTTADSGAAYGFELMNTSVYGMNKPFNRAAAPITGSVAQLNTGTKATGLALHAAGPSWFMSFTPYMPGAPGTAQDLKNVSYLARAAWLPTLFGLELGLGGGYFGGESYADATATPAAASYRIQDVGHDEPAASGATRVLQFRRAWFLDAQLQGKVLDRELGLYFLYGVGDQKGASNAWGGADHPPEGLSLNAEYSVLPQLGIIGSAGLFDSGAAVSPRYNEFGLGLNYNVAQNVQIQPLYQWLVGTTPDHRLSTRVSLLF